MMTKTRQRYLFAFILLAAVPALTAVSVFDFALGQDERPPIRTDARELANVPSDPPSDDKPAAKFAEATPNVQDDARIESGNKRERLVQGASVMVSWSAAKDELQGFSTHSGEWSAVKISPQESLAPAVGVTVAAVEIKDGVAAFSAVTGSWDLLKTGQNIKNRVEIRNDLVQVRSKGQLYTFAAAKGKWTSPTDPAFRTSIEAVRLRQLEPSAVSETVKRLMPNSDVRIVSDPQRELVTIAGARSDVEQVEQLIRKLEDVSPRRPSSFRSTRESAGTSGQVRHNSVARLYAGTTEYSKVEQRSLELARSLRESGRKDKESVDALRNSVAEVFDARVKLQESELAPLKTRLKEIESTLKNRRENRQKIIDRRVEELLNPELDWNSVSRGKSRRQTNVQAAMPVTQAGAAFQRRGSVRSTSAPMASDFASNGTPIGISGPAHIPMIGKSVRTDGFQTSTGLLTQLEGSRAAVETARKRILQHTAEVRDLKKKLDDGVSEELQRSQMTQALSYLQLRRAEDERKFNSATVVWQQQWNEFQNVLEKLRLEVSAEKLRVEQSQLRLQAKIRQNEQTPGSLISKQEIQEQEIALKLAELELQKAEQQYRLFKRIEDDHPELNPSAVTDATPSSGDRS